MKFSFGLAILCSACGLLTASAPADPLHLFATAPLRFEPAADGERSPFVSRGLRFEYEFKPTEIVLHNSRKTTRLQFVGASAGASMRAEEELVTKTNLYLGNDRGKWRTNIPNYGRLAVHGLYPGIDLLYYGRPGELEYDLTVKAGMDPNRIRFRVEGDDARLDRAGNLVSGIIQRRPVAYQTAANGKRAAVASRYRKNSDGTYGFALGPYDHTRELVIDPVLSFATYIAGSEQDIAYGIGHDKNGLLYVAGSTASTDLPPAGTPDQSTLAGGFDLFLAVINPNVPPVSQFYYTSYFGGSNDEQFGGMSVGPLGDVYLTGATSSTDLPTTANAYQTTLITMETTTNAFVAWFDRFQTMQFSSYLGGTGTDVGRAVAADANGVLWVTGSTDSTDFPQVNPMQIYGGQQDMFVAGFDPSQSSGTATLVYSSYLGGTGWDIGRGIAVASDGTLWVAGGTASYDINVLGSCVDCTLQGQGNGYLAHLNPSLGANALLFATYLGGSNLDEAKDVVIDPAGRIIIDGYTQSTNFPVTSNAIQQQFGGNTDAFVSIFDFSIPPTSRTAQLVYSSYFGGSDVDVPFDMKQDGNGSLYLSGYTLSPNLPTTANAIQPAYDGSMDAFGLKMTIPPSNAAGRATAGITYLTYLGSDGLQIAYGVDFDPSGNMYLAGFTSGPIFDPFGGPAKTTSAGNNDAFVVGFNPASPVTSTHFRRDIVDRVPDR